MKRRASLNSTAFDHNAAGNVTGDTRFDGTAYGYGYDGDGRLATVTRNALPEASYGYDAFQRRVLETAGGTTRHFLHDPDGHLLAEATSAGATTTEYVWLGDTPLAMVADVDTASPRLFWFRTDQLGTPQKLTDQAGNLAWDAVLEPFGELAALTVNLVAQPLRFPGQYADPATGLHQNWHRDYDPSLGRYLQPDPLGIAAGANLYGYAGGNPISRSDRDGRVWDTLLDFGFIGYDMGRLIADGPCDRAENIAALGADLLAAALPGITGLGLAIRGMDDIGLVAVAATRATKSADQGARLTEHLRQLEKYGGGGYRELANGRVRYYGNLEAARNAGPMAGRRLVREWNPATGATRTWHETVDAAGRTRIVRPETGGPKGHYEFDEAGNYVGKW